MQDPQPDQISKRQAYYEDWYLKRKPHGSSLYKRLTERFYISRNAAVAGLLESGEKYLDVGCGDGVLVRRALNKFEKCYGVDYSAAAVSMAEEVLGGKASFQKCDLEESDLPFEDEYFDCVTCVATLEHLFDPIHAMEEIIRVTKPGGTIILHAPNLGYWRHRLHLLVGKRPRTSFKPGWDGGHLQYFTVDDFRRFLPGRNVRINRIMGGAGRFMAARNIWPGLLAADLVVKGEKLA